MLIPIRCMTCGKLIANKYEYYQTELLRKKLAIKELKELKDGNKGKDGLEDLTVDTDPLIININAHDIKKTIAGEILDELGLHRMCCRKVLLTSINIINEI